MTAAAAGFPETREATQAKAREARAMTREGWSRVAIAERLGVSIERVGQYLRMPHLAEPDAADGRPRATQRRMTERTLLHRAFTAMRRIKAFRLLGADLREFWLEAVLEIREAGDGISLTFGEPGDLYRSRDEFLSAFDRKLPDLQNLLGRELLLEPAGGGLAMPFRFGLRPRERLSGPAVPSARARTALDPRDLPLPPMGMPRPPSAGDDAPEGRSSGNFGGNISPDRQNPGEIFGPERGNISSVGSATSGNSGQIDRNVGLAHANGTTTNKSEEDTSLVGGGTGSRAPRENFASDENFGAGEISVGGEISVNGENSAGSEISTAAAGAPSEMVLALAGSVQNAANYCPELQAAALHPRDLREVAGWIALGASSDLVLRKIKADRAKPDALPVYGLKLFTNSIKAAVELEKVKAAQHSAAASVPQAPALSPADQALKGRLRPMDEAWIKDRSCPFPPNLESFKAACATDGKAREYAEQWLRFWDAWDKAGRPRDLKPPDFNALTLQRAIFEERMLAIEGVLTEPGGEVR